jgi:hypothetical protein
VVCFGTSVCSLTPLFMGSRDVTLPSIFSGRQAAVDAHSFDEPARSEQAECRDLENAHTLHHSPRLQVLQVSAAIFAETYAFQKHHISCYLWSCRVSKVVINVQISCRPALLAGIQLLPANVSQIRENWQRGMGWELPKSVPYYLNVRFSDSEDDPEITVPCCCAWSLTGLSVMPANSKNGHAHPILHRLASK